MEYSKYLLHPFELAAMLQCRKAAQAQVEVEGQSLVWCYEKLTQTSRSFAVVIKKLSDELRDPVMIFYLVLRGLDSVEDDMAYDEEKKVEALQHFHEYIYDPTWSLEDCGEKEHERDLLRNFGHVTKVFLSLDEKYQDVIRDITLKMGHGMEEFLHKELVTKDDWNLYCHYVAGLVGQGLSRLFARSGLESEWFETADEISNSMGLFLQKTNIIRDYLEDVQQDRIFWPKEVWSQYADRIQAFAEPANTKSALHCLNHLVTNALEHIPDCLEYMERLTNADVFNFCAIPQAMAIGTLALCYNNPRVFRGVVKLRRGESACIFLDTAKGMPALHAYFYKFACDIEAKVEPSDPNCARTLAAIGRVKALCLPSIPVSTRLWQQATTGTAVVALAALTAIVVSHSR